MSDVMKRYTYHAHRVQTAINWLMQNDPGYRGHMPKHLRTGVDMSKSDMRGLAKLLMSKGLFTEEEYCEAMAQSAEQEAEEFQALVRKKLGSNIVTLG